ncbi:MAG: alpha-N-acetylglucosaminidase N-terminal domain-containing protein, partial [Paludibacteraceae bacterium]|nr:alpha-N-acetylglucosaminidase N-terminal domain-containing protein [Paludibacteraceae bacterium]
MRRFFSLSILLFCTSFCLFSVERNPSVLVDLLHRIGGENCAEKFVLIVDESLTDRGKDKFVITSEDNKPCIKGNSLLSVATGINWYLNHYANINLSWNNLTTNLNLKNLPLPLKTEERTCSAEYRYYLNYCTFSYSMSVWTWERWEQEIDWMALHGINMPLQIVGLDVVWKKLLTTYYNYSTEEVNQFVAGPCFQAWWGMNNLEAWGGPNPDWWYLRQEELAKKIGCRMRELGMQPVLPGFSGMVPSDFMNKTKNVTLSQGSWCFFSRPHILDPNSKAFASMAKNYYKVLSEVMGTSCYYSMDPFHEGANTSNIDVVKAYKSI